MEQESSGALVEAKETRVVISEPDTINPFSGVQAFETAQRMAKLLSSSTMVPADYRGSLENCLVAMEFAYRTRSSVFAVMQHAVVIHGKPGWTATYLIALINQSRKFETNLDFEYDGEGDSLQCRAFAKDRRSGKWRYGTWVSIAMAKKEGWFGRTGSKWQTMPEQMLAYRAAAFFARMHASDVVLGMQTAEELQDLGQEPQYVEGTVVGESNPVNTLREKLAGTIDAEQVVEGELVDPGPAPAETPEPPAAEPPPVAETESAPAPAKKAADKKPPKEDPPEAPEPPSAEAESAPPEDGDADEEQASMFGGQKITLNDVMARIGKSQSKNELDEVMDWSREADLKPADRKRLSVIRDARLEQLGEL